jgi:hypothetical protein
LARWEEIERFGIETQGYFETPWTAHQQTAERFAISKSWTREDTGAGGYYTTVIRMEARVQPTLVRSTSRRTGHPDRLVAFSGTATSAGRSGRRDRLMDRGFGKPPMAFGGAVDQRGFEILEVRRLPPDPNDRSKVIEPEPD